MLTNFLILIFGLYILVKGADFLIEGSIKIAKTYGISNLVIGLTIVTFGTTMPELVVSVVSSVKGSNGIIMGNLIGSNVANMLLVLGATALFTKIKVKDSVIKKEIPFLIFSVFLLITILFFEKEGLYYISRANGLTLLSFFLLFIIYLFNTSRKTEVKEVEEEVKIIKKEKINKDIAYIILGLVGLYFGGNFIVDNAIAIANIFNVSEFLISATIIAIGTSLPELVTSVMAAKKQRLDLAVGNIVGSNIFNLLWIVGVSASIRQIAVSPEILVDLFILLGISIFFLLSIIANPKREITKNTGRIFLSVYVVYLVMILLRNVY
ncbi:calcium/sodium antiporter [Candidatus Woesearchaeota archaeon]|nr:calcium/sodium antiporter [Candidatus Woesearchaeota archaeon]